MTTDNRTNEPNKYVGFLARQEHQRDPWLDGVKCLCGKGFDLDADHALHQVEEILRAALSSEEYEAEFDRWLAEVERKAAEKAWDRCVGEMPIDPDWKNFYVDNNPYSAEACRQERKEQ